MLTRMLGQMNKLWRVAIETMGKKPLNVSLATIKPSRAVPIPVQAPVPVPFDISLLFNMIMKNESTEKESIAKIIKLALGAENLKLSSERMQALVGSINAMIPMMDSKAFIKMLFVMKILKVPLNNCTEIVNKINIGKLFKEERLDIMKYAYFAGLSMRFKLTQIIDCVNERIGSLNIKDFIDALYINARTNRGDGINYSKEQIEAILKDNSLLSANDHFIILLSCVNNANHLHLNNIVHKLLMNFDPSKLYAKQLIYLAGLNNYNSCIPIQMRRKITELIKEKLSSPYITHLMVILLNKCNLELCQYAIQIICNELTIKQNFHLFRSYDVVQNLKRFHAKFTVETAKCLESFITKNWNFDCGYDLAFLLAASLGKNFKSYRRELVKLIELPKSIKESIGYIKMIHDLPEYSRTEEKMLESLKASLNTLSASVIINLVNINPSKYSPIIANWLLQYMSEIKPNAFIKERSKLAFMGLYFLPYIDSEKHIELYKKLLVFPILITPSLEKIRLSPNLNANRSYESILNAMDYTHIEYNNNYKTWLKIGDQFNLSQSKLANAICNHFRKKNTMDLNSMGMLINIYDDTSLINKEWIASMLLNVLHSIKITPKSIGLLLQLNYVMTDSTKKMNNPHIDKLFQEYISLIIHDFNGCSENWFKLLCFISTTNRIMTIKDKLIITDLVKSNMNFLNSIDYYAANLVLSILDYRNKSVLPVLLNCPVNFDLIYFFNKISNKIPHDIKYALVVSYEMRILNDENLARDIFNQNSKIINACFMKASFIKLSASMLSTYNPMHFKRIVSNRIRNDKYVETHLQSIMRARHYTMLLSYLSSFPMQGVQIDDAFKTIISSINSEKYDLSFYHKMRFVVAMPQLKDIFIKQNIIQFRDFAERSILNYIIARRLGIELPQSVISNMENAITSAPLCESKGFNNIIVKNSINIKPAIINGVNSLYNYHNGKSLVALILCPNICFEFISGKFIENCSFSSIEIAKYKNIPYSVINKDHFLHCSFEDRLKIFKQLNIKFKVRRYNKNYQNNITIDENSSDATNSSYFTTYSYK